MNAYVGSNRLCDEQSIRRKDESDSPRTRGLRMDVIWANDKEGARTRRRVALAGLTGRSGGCGSAYNPSCPS